MKVACHSNWKNRGQDFVAVSAEEDSWTRNEEVMKDWRKPRHEEHLLVAVIE
jgi:hypothetical protein